MYGRHSGLFGSSLGLGIFKSCKKNRNYHSGRADYDGGDRAGPGACHGFREVAKSGAQPEPARPRLVRRLWRQHSDYGRGPGYGRDYAPSW